MTGGLVQQAAGSLLFFETDAGGDIKGQVKLPCVLQLVEKSLGDRDAAHMRRCCGRGFRLVTWNVPATAALKAHKSREATKRRIDLPWSSIPPRPSILPCRLPHPDRCMLPCRPPHPDHHGHCSPGCPWHPCPICIVRAGCAGCATHCTMVTPLGS